MSLDFCNINTLWSSVIVETFYRLGLTTAIICPGSRSTPLTIAFTKHSGIECIPILDERSASFFALGIAKRTGNPVVLICTSGTAGANFYPAVIEAKYSQIPLIILTADRPLELRNCHGGQTIDQVKLYGNYPNWQTELAVPSGDKEMLFYLKQNIVQGWERSCFPYGGVVHFNLPFRDPLVPIEQSEIKMLDVKDLEEELLGNISNNSFIYSCFLPNINVLVGEWQKYDRGIILAGVDDSDDPEKYCRCIAFLGKLLHFPVLAEALSPIRNYADFNPYLISSYDLILRSPEIAENLAPELVIQVGELPTSKEVRNWLNRIKPKTYIIKNSSDNLDGIHSNSIHIRTCLINLMANVSVNSQVNNSLYLESWLNLDREKNRLIGDKFESIDILFEGKVAWMLSKSLPVSTPIFIANSMSVRYCEFFWQKNHLKIKPYFNRGANGIDGSLSTALGVAHGNQGSIMLTGDLALLHDINGFLSKRYFRGHLTIVLINNNGGGIFEMLSISEFNPPFEEFFATPQDVDFAKICDCYNIEYELIDCWENLADLLNPLPLQGIRVLELQTNRKKDSFWLNQEYVKI